jgi:hypothetical protein
VIAIRLKCREEILAIRVHQLLISLLWMLLNMLYFLLCIFYAVYSLINIVVVVVLGKLRYFIVEEKEEGGKIRE